MPQVGLSDLHYALLISDTDVGATYAAPVAIPGAITADINPNPSSGTLFADNAPAESATTIGEIELTLNPKELTIEQQAELLGHAVVGGVMKRATTDEAPEVAIGFKALKSNGSYKYVWLLKGRFQVPELKNKTKEATVDFQTPVIVGKFLARNYDKAWIKETDEDHPDYVPATGTNWFTQVEAADDTTAPTVTLTSPLDAAIDVAIDTNIEWTMSEDLTASTVSTRSVLLIKASDGSVIAGAVSYSAATDKITFNPDANLANSTAYIAILTTAITDLAGNHLAAPNVINFTTIAP
jgi:phi13 family phage major tail protein